MAKLLSNKNYWIYVKLFVFKSQLQVKVIFKLQSSVKENIFNVTLLPSYYVPDCLNETLQVEEPLSLKTLKVKSWKT